MKKRFKKLLIFIIILVYSDFYISNFDDFDISKMIQVKCVDTKIEYNVGEAVVSTSNGASLTSSDKEFLKQYRRARCY